MPRHPVVMLAINFSTAHKVHVSSWNGGLAARCVRVIMRAGPVLVGFVANMPHDEQDIELYTCDALLSRRLRAGDYERVEPIEMLRLPTKAYHTYETTTGGIGWHSRRRIRVDAGDGAPTAVFVDHEGRRRLPELGRLLTSMPNVSPRYDEQNAINCGYLPCCIDGDVQGAVLELARNDFVLRWPKDTAKIDLLCNSLNRLTSTQFELQRDECGNIVSAGAKRSFDHWLFALPPNVKYETPFSWFELAANVADEVVRTKNYEAVLCLRDPLMWYVVEALVQTLDADYKREQAFQKRALEDLARARREAIELEREGAKLRARAGALARAGDTLSETARRCDAELESNESQTRQNDAELDSLELAYQHSLECVRRVREPFEQGLLPRHPDFRAQFNTYYFLARLSPEQNEQLLEAYHQTFYADRWLTDEQRRANKALLTHYPLLTGHMAHGVNSYHQTCAHVGSGATLRYPDEVLKLIEEDALPNAAHNRLRKEGGKLRGRGSQPYKGKFSKGDGDDSPPPPKRQRRRTTRALETMTPLTAPQTAQC